MTGSAACLLATRLRSSVTKKILVDAVKLERAAYHYSLWLSRHLESPLFAKIAQEEWGHYATLAAFLGLKVETRKKKIDENPHHMSDVWFQYAGVSKSILFFKILLGGSRIRDWSLPYQKGLFKVLEKIQAIAYFAVSFVMPRPMSSVFRRIAKEEMQHGLNIDAYVVIELYWVLRVCAAILIYPLAYLTQHVQSAIISKKKQGRRNARLRAKRRNTGHINRRARD